MPSKSASAESAQDLVFSEMETLPQLDEGELDHEGTWTVSPRHCLALEKRSAPVLTDNLERELLHYALSQQSMSQVKLADRLGMNRGTLRKLLKQFGFEDSSDES